MRNFTHTVYIQRHVICGYISLISFSPGSCTIMHAIG